MTNPTLARRWTYIVALAAVCIAIWMAAIFIPHDNTDPPEGRSGLHLMTDAGTGCQYLGNGYHGITPRLDGTGKHMGCRHD